MIRAYISSVSAPSEVSPGEDVAVRVFVGNAGDQAGSLIVGLRYLGDSTDVQLWSDWVWKEIAGLTQFDFSFPMPTHDITVRVTAWVWDDAAGASRLDDTYPDFTISIPAAPSPTPPEPSLSGFLIPTEARAGSAVHVETYLTNVGGQAALFRLKCTYSYGTESGISFSGNIEVAVGQTVSVGADFTMPDMDTTVTLQGEYFDESLLAWQASGNTITATIAVIKEDWPHLAMPAWLLNILEHDWANLEVGELLDVEVAGIGLRVPPFPFTPGYWIRDAINWILDGINWMIDGIRDLVGRVDEAWDSLTNIAVWIANSLNWFEDQVTRWWANTWSNVDTAFGKVFHDMGVELEWVVGKIGEANKTLADLASDLNNFKEGFLGEILKWDIFKDLLDNVGEIDDWFIEVKDSILAFVRDPAGWIFDRIDDWLNEEVE